MSKTPTDDACPMAAENAQNERLVAVELDQKSIARNSPDIERERNIAIDDLLEHNRFALIGDDHQGPYTLLLTLKDNRLVFHVMDENRQPLTSHFLSLSPFRRLIKDYFIVCESYFEAIKTAPASRIEAIDMGRRGLHDEGAHLLIERLERKICLDFETARRLFTLISVLYWRKGGHR